MADCPFWVCVVTFCCGRGRSLPLACALARISLYGCHYVSLLREERVAEIGGPTNVLVQTGEHVGKYDQRLNAGVPILLLSGVDQACPFRWRFC